MKREASPALAHGPLHMKLVLVDLCEPVFGRLKNESLRRARHGVSDGSVDGGDGHRF